MKKRTQKTAPAVQQQPENKLVGGKIIRMLLACGLLAVAILIVYGRACRFGVTDLDDDNLIRIFTGHHYGVIDAFRSDAFMHQGGSDFYRPLQSLSFIVDAARSGTNPSAWHFTNIMLHWLAVCSLLGLLLLLGIDRRLSFSGALLYAVHPLFAQAVAWIPGRGDLLLGLFSLLAFATFILYYRSGKVRFLGLHAAAFFFAPLSKESGIMLPLLFAAYPFLSGIKRPDAKFFILLPVWITAGAAYLLLRHGGMASLPGSEMFGIAPLAANLRVLPEMLRYFVIPFAIPVMPGFSLVATTIGLATAAALAFVLGKGQKLRSPLVILGALLYVLVSLPGMMYRHEFGSHAYDFLNHRSYLPMAGIFMVLAAVVPARWYSAANRKRFAIVAGAIVVALAAGTWRQCGYFADAGVFFDQAVRTNPNSALALNNRSTLKMEQGDIAGALRDCAEAIRLFPGYAEAHLNSGNARFMLGDAKGAVADYTRAIELKPGNINAFDNRARARDQLGDVRGVVADLTEAIRIDPSAPDRYFQRGRFEEAAGDTAQAVADYSKTIEIEPRFADAYVQRGMILRSRNNPEANEDFRRAEALDPSLAGTLPPAISAK